MISSVLEAFKFLKYTGKECKAVSRKLMKIEVECPTISRWQEDKKYASESTERRGFLKPLRELQPRGRGEIGKRNFVKTVTHVKSTQSLIG